MHSERATSMASALIADADAGNYSTIADLMDRCGKLRTAVVEMALRDGAYLGQTRSDVLESLMLEHAHDALVELYDWESARGVQ